MSYLDELEDSLRSEDRPFSPTLLRVMGELRERLEKLDRRVIVVDELPQSAPLGTTIRLRKGTQAERVAIYWGNGPGQPLTKTVPQVV